MKNKKRYKWLTATTIGILLCTSLFFTGHDSIVVKANDSTASSMSDGTKKADLGQKDWHLAIGDSSSTDDDDDDDGDSQYSSLKIPSRLTTAYHDAYQKTLSSDGKKGGGKEDRVLRANIQKVLSTGFFNVGALIGPLSLSQRASGTDSVSQKASASVAFLKSYMVSRDGSGNSSPGMAYYAFGKAFADTAKIASNIPMTGVRGDELSAALRKVSGKVAEFGLTGLDYFSPAPIILSFYTPGAMAQKRYQKNVFVKFVSRVSVAQEILKFFCQPAPAPFSTMTVTTMITFILILTLLAFYAASALMAGGGQFSVWIRRCFIKVLIVAVGIPISMKLFDEGTGILEEFADKQNESAYADGLSRNLGLAMWARAGFSIPKNVTLQVKDNKFMWTDENVERINVHSARVLGYISASDEGRIINAKKSDGSIDASRIAILEKMVSFSNSDKQTDNVATIAWADPINSAGEPYHTDDLNALCDKLGANENISAGSVNLMNIGYLNNGQMQYSGSGSNFRYTQKMGDSNYLGFSPLAAYNFLCTDFSDETISAKGNMSDAKIPAIAMQAPSYNLESASSIRGGEKKETRLSPLVSGLLSALSLWYAIRGMMTIISGGFGGMLLGAGRSAFGSAAGFGELIGGVVAIIGGLIGFALLNVLLLQSFDFIYGFINDNILKNIPGLGAMLKAGESLAHSWFAKVPLIGPAIVGIGNFANLICSFVMVILGASVLRIPLLSFAQMMGSMPARVAASFSRMENRLTGNYGAGVGSAWSGSGSGARSGGMGGQILGGALGSAGAMMTLGKLGGKSLADAARQGRNKIAAANAAKNAGKAAGDGLSAAGAGMTAGMAAGMTAGMAGGLDPKKAKAEDKDKIAKDTANLTAKDAKAKDAKADEQEQAAKASELAQERPSMAGQEQADKQDQAKDQAQSKEQDQDRQSMDNQDAKAKDAKADEQEQAAKASELAQERPSMAGQEQADKQDQAKDQAQASDVTNKMHDQVDHSERGESDNVNREQSLTDKQEMANTQESNDIQTAESVVSDTTNTASTSQNDDNNVNETINSDVNSHLAESVAADSIDNSANASGLDGTANATGSVADADAGVSGADAASVMINGHAGSETGNVSQNNNSEHSSLLARSIANGTNYVKGLGNAYTNAKTSYLNQAKSGGSNVSVNHAGNNSVNSAQNISSKTKIGAVSAGLHAVGKQGIQSVKSGLGEMKARNIQPIISSIHNLKARSASANAKAILGGSVRAAGNVARNSVNAGRGLARGAAKVAKNENVRVAAAGVSELAANLMGFRDSPEGKQRGQRNTMNASQRFDAYRSSNPLSMKTKDFKRALDNYYAQTPGVVPPVANNAAANMPNGAMPNGIVPNVPNGTMPNGIVPNAAMPNGATPTGAMPNGATPNGATPSGTWQNAGATNSSQTTQGLQKAQGLQTKSQRLVPSAGDSAIAHQKQNNDTEIDD